MKSQILYKAASILLLFVVYLVLFINSGVISEENIDTAQQSARYKGIVCPKTDSFSDARVDLLDSPNANILKRIENSDSLFYSRVDRSIVAIDALSNLDLSIASDLSTLGLIKKNDAKLLETLANRKFTWCDSLETDIGFSEYYWGTKGTAVLHHWSYLYDGALGLGGHAQYGYFVPTVARLFNVSMNLEGPYYFIRASFIVFFFIAIAYTLLLYKIFDGHAAATTCFLALKVCFFASIGLFTLLMAPGYEWTRDFVFLLFALLLLRLDDRENATIVNLIIFILGFILDPTIATVGTVAILAIYLKFNSANVYLLVKNRTFQISSVIFLLAAYFLVASKLAYIYENLNFFATSVNLWGRYSLILLALSAPMLFVLMTRSFLSTRLNCYFAIVGIVSAAYYFITPDQQHFYKTIEYMLPFYLAVFCSCGLKDRGFYSTGIVVGLSIVFSVWTLLSLPKDYYFRVWDSWGNYFTNARTLYINNRKIVGYIDDAVYKKLNEFPSLYTNGVVVFSSYDKHLLMLFDVRNGFGNPDIVSTLNKYSRFEILRKSIFDRDIVLDQGLLTVNVGTGLKRGNPYGDANANPSHWRLKSLLYAREFALYIDRNCVKNQSGLYWARYNCKHYDSNM